MITIDGLLIDTGVLLRGFDARFADYRTIRRAFRMAVDDGRQLFVTVQNVAEFWNVATRPLDKNGHGLSVESVRRRVAVVERLCRVICEDNASYQIWKRMVDELGVSGVAVHDARIVSVMLRMRIQHIVTLNGRDFRRYAGEGIVAVTPEEFLSFNTPGS